MSRIAKNLLLRKTCFNCFYAVLEEDEEVKDDQINTCWLHADDMKNSSYENFPKENTCDEWLMKSYLMGSGYEMKG